MKPGRNYLLLDVDRLFLPGLNRILVKQHLDYSDENE